MPFIFYMSEHDHHQHTEHGHHPAPASHSASAHTRHHVTAEKHDDAHGSHGGTGHDKHAGHNVADFRKRFFICLIVTIPVLLLSHMIQQWLGFNIGFPGDRYVLAILSTFIFLYGGYPFLRGLYDEVKNNAIGMMTLIGVAITVAWAYSVAVTFGLQGMDFYWEMATLIDIMLIGHYFEMKSVMGASRSLELLVRMMPATAHLITDGSAKEVSVT